MRVCRTWPCVSLSALLFAVVACERDGRYEPHEPSGSAGSAGSAGSSQGGSDASTGGQAGSAGTSPGGQAGEAATYPAPSVASTTPDEGPYGAHVVIEGEGLGSVARDGVFLKVGDQDPIELYPDSSPEVVSWSEERIEFRYPFPATGKIVLTTPEGTLTAGDFQPSWVVSRKHLNAPTGPLLASVSTGEGKLAALFDGSPPRLFELGPDGSSELEFDPGAALPASLRLYLDGDGVLQAFGVEEGADAEIVAIENQEGAFSASNTGVALDLAASELATAGGPDGAVVWMRRSDGWWRARPVSGVWTVDKGPIADPKPSETLRASGATSDGSLYVGWGVDTSFAFDDTETPYLVRLAPSALDFDDAAIAGGMTDDYLTSLSFEGRGRGLVTHYCGSDVDPFGLSGTEYQCFTGLRPQNGTTFEDAARETNGKARHAFSATEALMSECEDDSTLRLRSDQLSETEPGEDLVFLCREPLALEIDSANHPVPLLREGSILYLLAPRP